MPALIITAFFAAWIVMGNTKREPNWRLAFVQAAIVLGAYMIFVTEILSLFSFITRWSLFAVWLLPNVVFLVWVWVWMHNGRVLRLPIIYRFGGWISVILDLAIVAILLITFLVGFASPPNSNQAMASDMARVAHWADNQSLGHYLTGVESQNSAPPGAAIFMLNFYLLGNGDAWVNLVTWFGFALSAAAAASLAEAFGASINGQRFAAVFALTIPAAIALSSSSLNFLPLAGWIMATVLMIIFYLRVEKNMFFTFLSALSAGIAIVTDPVSLIFILPFSLVFTVYLFKTAGWLKGLAWLFLAFWLALTFNLGYLLRNEITYRNILRQSDVVTAVNSVFNWRSTVSNISRNLVLNANLTSQEAVDWMEDRLDALHDGLDFDLSDPRTTVDQVFAIKPINTSENYTGNPVHIYILMVAIPVFLLRIILRKTKAENLYFIVCLLVSVLIYSLVLKWQGKGTGAQLPFFFLCAPIAALFLDGIEKHRFGTLVSLLLVGYSFFWLLGLQERPLIPRQPDTYPRSVLVATRQELYFAHQPELFESYQQISDLLLTNGITHIGVDLITYPEYPFWGLLGAPRNPIQMKWMNTTSESQKYKDVAFIPDAVICDHCAYQGSYLGLPLAFATEDGLWVYIKK